jgi:hypothetical protein
MGSRLLAGTTRYSAAQDQGHLRTAPRPVHHVAKNGEPSRHRALSEQLSHDFPSLQGPVPLAHGVELLCHPCAGAEECVSRYLGRRSFRCFINEQDVFSWQPFRLDQFTVFSIIPVIDPCLRHIDSPKNNRSRHLLPCAMERKKNPQPCPGGVAPFCYY